MRIQSNSTPPKKPKELDLVMALNCLHKPSMAMLIDSTGMSQATVQRKLRDLREIYKMTITFYREGRERGGKGYYIIEDWGVFDEKEFIKK